MSKKNKNYISNEGPEIYNIDDIGYMSDEAVYDRANRLESERNRLVSSGRDAYLWEVEIAYLQREQQLRQIRSERHAEFLKSFTSQSHFDEVVDAATSGAVTATTLN